MKIAIAQLNYHIGNFEGNCAKMLDAIETAKSQQADIVVFSELSVCGYPPRDFLEFNELENDALANSEEDLEFSELDIDMLSVDFLTDLLDVVEALERTKVTLADAQAGSGNLSGFTLKGAAVGFNKDSQFNVFEQDGNLVFFRSVNGVINIIIGAGGSGFIDVVTNDYEGVMQFNDGDGIEIFINQSN